MTLTSDTKIVMNQRDHKDALKHSEETSNKGILLEDTLKEPEQGKEVVDEFEQAGVAFDQLHKVFRKVAYNMRKKHSPAHVLEHILFSPAIDIELFGQEEKDLLAICANVFKNKIKLMEYTIKRKAEEQQLTNDLEKENQDGS